MIFRRHLNCWTGLSGPLLAEKQLIHGFSTRRGGASDAPFDSLNLGNHTADKPECVRENRHLFLQSLQLHPDRLVMPVQVHGDRVGIAKAPGEIPDTDAVITNQPDLILSIQVADCVPVFLFDPVSRVIGLVHAGWKGSAGQITEKTVRAMQYHFNSNPDRLRAFVGPSIGPCCYSVQGDTASHFTSRYFRNGSLDLWQVNRDQLTGAGVPEHRIELSGICTKCNSRFFFSYRASGGSTGRMMAVMMLTETE
ncbi:peptidoglycan editing factor PgeF [bacterium]|nr:peptidoglycan editing factor PgeF [bacterium]